MNESKRKSPLAAPFVRAIVSIGLILAVVLSLDTREIGQALSAVSLYTIVALTVVDIVLRLLSALRWHVLIAPIMERTSFENTSRTTFIASFLGQALPGVVGVEALRIYRLSKYTGDSGGAVASVVADKVFGLASLAIVIVFGALIGPDTLRELILVPVIVVMLLLALLSAMLVVPALRSLTVRLIPSAIRTRIDGWIERVHECFDHYSGRPGFLVFSLILATTFQFGRILLFFMAAVLIGESPDFIYFVSIVPIVMFAALLPVSIAGLGVREASLVFFFSQFGVMSSASAFTVSILVFLSGVLSTLPGAWFYTREGKKLKEAIRQ